MSGDESGATGLTQRDLLMEMREDIKGHLPDTLLARPITLHPLSS